MQIFYNHFWCIKYPAVIILLCLFFKSAEAQTEITGAVKDDKGKPVSFANVYLKGSTDGAITDSAGGFHFTTLLKDSQTLIISSIGFQTLNYPVFLADKKYEFPLILKATPHSLEEVVITAGTMEASDDRAVAVLTPLDIVTVAGGQGDIVGAIQTLPGVQRNGGDQTGLMVRGGDVSESEVIVDGMVSQNAFFSAIPGVSQRSRFSPFQFKGTSFSSGGYSARYGQALSAILDLQTTDLPEKTTVNAGANFAGVYVSGDVLLGDNSISVAGNYTNLTPYYLIARTNDYYYQKPQGGGFSARWLSKIGDKGMFKMNLQYGTYKTGVNIPDPDSAGQNINFGLTNENIFFTTSFRYWLTNKLLFFTALSFSNNDDNIQWGSYPVIRKDSRLQARTEVNYNPVHQFNLLAGAEVQRINYSELYDTLSGAFDEILTAAYMEGEWKPINWFAIKLGARGEYSYLLNRFNAAPRISMAVKTGNWGQISAAGGMFYQLAPPAYLLEGYRPDFQLAVHYMLNYQLIKDDRTFRLEGYYKSYYDLIREKGLPYDPNPYRYNFGTVDNSGGGYARGVDVFWRDKKSIKNFDYWISYSFIDTKRLYQNYLAKVTPDYISPNNLNVITKYFIEKIQTNISLSYNYATGRHYYNPDNPVFFGDKAPDYHNLAATIAYLLTVKKVFMVIYLSGDNIINRHNILGYRYSDTGDTRYPILPPTYASIFFGFNLSLSQFSKDEL